jgi:hypothetical protein
MVYSSAKPELVIRLVCGTLLRGPHKYYPRLGDQESDQF